MSWEHTGGADANGNTAGDVAHDSPDSGNPVKVGAVAKETDSTDPGSVAENDRTNLIADRNGRLFVNISHPNLWTANNNFAGAQTDTSIKAAPGEGLSLYITDVILTTDTAMNIQLEDGDDADVIPPLYFAANGGASMNFQTAIRLTANRSLTITSSAGGNHSVLVNGYIAP